MIKELEGIIQREADSYLLASKALRENNPLNLKTGTLDAHHIISDMVIDRLATFRQYQLERKGWNLNHGKNLVLLSSDSEICCYYETPQHSSGHTEIGIEDSFYGRKSKKITDLKAIRPGEDRHVVSKTKGYHKVVAIKLAMALKHLNCDTEYKLYVSEVDKVSDNLLGFISSFKLLLKADGRRFKSMKEGCGECSSRDSHFDAGHFVFFNKSYDRTETEVYTSGNEKPIMKVETYVKKGKEYQSSVNKQKVYENVYREVLPKDKVRKMIYNSLEFRLFNVSELKKKLS
ncbi:AHH domain-containing protein [uncultured Photobacterium sp.]|uniref:AHH domain-containing protein n=1 Tax=uncultured Photobacterium sp. TaxID=173973 RepID=UPI0026164E1B|nr:AHH domain-containing protein [uncultured Photobacterium sp.]